MKLRLSISLYSIWKSRISYFSFKKNKSKQILSFLESRSIPNIPNETF